MKRIEKILPVVALLLVVWLVNQLVDRWNVRLDLTEEKRYTILLTTKELLKNLNEEVFFEVYLAGDLPPNFERFRKSIGEMLEQFSEESGQLVQYKFTNPSQATSNKSRQQFYQTLLRKGLQSTDLTYVSDGEKKQQRIFPSAIASVGVNEYPVNFLKGNRSAGPEGMLNQSVEGLEYELAAAITQLVSGGMKKIGLIKGHGSPDSVQLVSLKRTILSKYNLYDVDLSNKKILTGYDAIVLAKPTAKFSEQEKYLIDQYLMNGGNLLFFLDALSVNMDSVSGEGTIAIPYETNLDDLLFRYGVRINKDYVLDVNSGQLPVVVGNFGNQSNIKMIPWPFFPIITSFSKHPAVRNLDAIQARFVSSIDTVKAVGVQKTPLLTTSEYTKLLGPPVRVAFNDLRDELRPDKFTDGSKTVGYLLEGNFRSLYANRLVPVGFDKNAFIPKSENKGKAIVIADGDIVRNDLDNKTGAPLALGVEPMRKNTYANEQLVLNLLDYLVDDSGLINARARQVKIRPLDRVKVKQEKRKWQVINLVIPLVILILFGLVKWYLRKRKYASK